MTGQHRRRGAKHTLTLLAGVATISGVLVVPLAVGALPSECVQTTSTKVTCTYTTFGSFVVPAGVTSVHVHAVGGNGFGASATTGRGGVVDADLSVTAGSFLNSSVNVNGGKPGGGGLSELHNQVSEFNAIPLVVAGGGGAEGLDDNFGGLQTARPGGNAGYPSGGGGSGVDGGGGTQTQGGSGGSGVAGNGNAGDQMVGGDGSLGAGGGGAGYFGGGGGGDNEIAGLAGSTGAGGGGSDFGPAGATYGLTGSTDSPEVVITYSTAPPTTVTFGTATPPNGTVNQPYGPFHYSATASDGSAVSYTGSGLPPGLTLSTSGALSGTPSTAGTFSITVTASTASGGTATRTDSITIQAGTPKATFTPNPLDFGTQQVGTTSAGKTLTQSSTGTATYSQDGWTITGPNAPDFSVTTGCTKSLDPGQSCTWTVYFTPSTNGAESATLTANDNAGGTSATLTGSGQSLADLGVSMSGNPNSVLSGGALTYASTVVNHGPQAATGITLSVSLSPSVQFTSLNSPSGWTCTTPASGHSGTVVCTIASLANGASASFTISVKVVQAGKGSVTSTATVSASGSTDGQTSNNTVLVTTSVKGGQK